MMSLKIFTQFFTFYINNNDLPAVHGSRNCTIYFLKKIPAVTHAIYSAFIKLVFKKKFFWPMKLLNLEHDIVNHIIMILKCLYDLLFKWVKPFT